MITRRTAVVAIGSTMSAFSARSYARPAIARWLLGTWQSDRDRTMENLHFQGKAIPESKREAFAANFGHLTYIISKSTFTLKDEALGGGINQMALEYKVEGYTDTSITLSLQGNIRQRPLTLYRASVDSLFVKAGSNLEYFKRIAA